MAAVTLRANQQCNVTSEFQEPSLSKWGQVHNLSCESEFYLHENDKSFSNQRLSTYPRFDTEARGNSEMAYYFWIWAVQYYRAFSLTWPVRMQIYWKKLTISSCVSVRMSRYWARRKFAEHERGIRVARGAAESNSSILVLFKLPKCSISRHTHCWGMI